MLGDLVELAQFPSSAEAAIVRGRLDAEGIRSELDGEAMASWFWYFGSAVGGVRLLVSEDDVDRAAELLGTDASIDETHHIDFGDESDHDDSESKGSQIPECLTRVWRASLIGFLLFPPLLNLYSTWILIRNGFFIGRCRNWRVAAACVANAVVFALVILIVFLIANPPPPPPQYFTPDGEPVDVKHETKTIDLLP
jgi:Putative prokaryotic signal transducing protein